LDLSFVVIAYNEAPNIARTLNSIAAQTGLPAETEVVVVDDASTDDTAAIVERVAAEHPFVRLVRLPRNSGRGFARATGIDAASGELIATIDADIVLPPDWYTRCRDGMGDLDAVGGIAVPDGDVCYLYNRFGLEPRPVMHTAELTGNNALYRRKVFELVGFDGDLRNGEDVALGHEMRSAGVRTATLDGVFVRHEETKSYRKSLAWLFESGIGASRQLRRYREIRQPDVVLAGWVAVLLAALGLARAGRRGSAPALPLLYLSAASAAHVRSRFFLGGRPSGRVAGAFAVDATLLLAYLTGRVVGLARPG
jgi:glycosyltransferase involved in cell wall biosynthesis